ncbi:MAG: preprotein translocase subunit SecE [Microthrixaceae bacterium]
MNREQKRAMQRAGQLDAEGSPVRERRDPAQRARSERVGARQFLAEVRSEMRKVAWPTREETIRLSIIVFIAVVALGALIFVLDLGAGQISHYLFPSKSITSTTTELVLAAFRGAP